MNGMATVSPFFVPNMCQCGHDYVAHNIAGSTCSLCVGTGASQNRHNFAALMETLPALSFLNCMQYGYINPGGFGQLVALTSSGINNPAAATITVSSTAGLKAGMSIYINPQPQANQSLEYKILSIISGTSIGITPNLQFGFPSGTSIIAVGIYGSTMGPALPGNSYQRAG